MEAAVSWPQHEALVSSFEWQPSLTPGATWASVMTWAIGYVVLVLVLDRLLASCKLAPLPLGPIPAVHNFILCVGSLVMFLGTLQGIFVEAADPMSPLVSPHTGAYVWLICLPPGTRPSGRMFFWSYVYYLSKFYELLDTLILVLKRKPLTLLQVYHHATVLLMCFFWLQYAQSLQTVALLANTGIHVLMYYYFMMHSLGRPPPWKRFVTNSQIIQFVFSGMMSVPLVVRHFTSAGGCSGMGAWAFNLVFNLTLLALFVQFHRQQFGSRKKSISNGLKKDA